MNKIEKMHLDAIKNCKNVVAFNIFGTMIYTVDENLAPTEASKLTEQVSIEFAGWLGQNYFEQNQSEKWTSKLLVFSGCIYSTSELFQQFLKTKQ